MTDQPKIYYYYLRDGSNRPIGTVAFIVENPGLGGELFVTRGMALCCPTDNVNKAKGREIAERKCLRYRKKKIASPKIVKRVWWYQPAFPFRLGMTDAYVNQGYCKLANRIELKILKLSTE